ncbi:MAG: Omp28-related outer membrane protein, partial [Chitinophagaceae bacterium]
SQNTLYVVKIINDNLIVYYNVSFDNNLNYTLQRQGTGFTKKSIAEMYTGTWCGICPGTLIPLENYINTHPKTFFIAIHGPNGSNDPYTYVYDAQLRAAFNISGVPTVVLNRDTKWANPNDTSTLNQLTIGKTSTGISIETSINGSLVNVISKVKFDSTISQPLKLAIALVEDSMAFNQANYGHFGLPNPIANYCHRNALRKMATDILGDAIPLASTTAGNVYQSTFSINASGYNLSKCRIIAYVVYANSSPKKGVLNAQQVTVGQNQNFD